MVSDAYRRKKQMIIEDENKMYTSGKSGLG